MADFGLFAARLGDLGAFFLFFLCFFDFGDTSGLELESDFCFDTA